MLTIKVINLERVFRGLQKIITASDQKPTEIPTGIQYWAFRLQRKLEPELKSFTDVKIPLLKKYATEIYQEQKGQMKKDDSGKMIPVSLPTGQFVFNSDKDREKYEKEIKSISEKEVVIESNVYKKTFNEIVELKLGSTILFDLESILEDKDEKDNSTEDDKA